MPVAESRRGRRGPSGKVPQDNVLHVNLDVRTGVPRATLVKGGKDFALNGSHKTVLGASQGSPPPKNHVSSIYLHNKASYPSPNTNAHYRETLDEPPRYDDLFKNHLNGQEAPVLQGQKRNHDKKHFKSYLFKHFSKPKPFGKGGSGKQPSSGSYKGRRAECYAEITIPPTAPLDVTGFPKAKHDQPLPQLHPQYSQPYVHPQAPCEPLYQTKYDAQPQYKAESPGQPTYQAPYEAQPPFPAAPQPNRAPRPCEASPTIGARARESQLAGAAARSRCTTRMRTPGSSR
nr:uncharacterized protein LOC113810729 [Penaeus vannamei]XP_027218162.1 uncharacterized protein LOC113810729 [Penaeus vannamei]XP_027218163.1 uncharacterized protein LOC113810729 [Penaeus vannamei]XP_027218164.1 uncharacterized protein LOC113810729 [Penaeus vannamei]XP_027218165.1 uncharacterized protein LOC113810729 [Penaeus vannamei]XP_027218166.1 uncharacterized protein LOC113810729 [Penaeus vannamei]XP_027218167.1 uncharacterized protein LOC113810729 [Penaeus vannamei]